MGEHRQCNWAARQWERWSRGGGGSLSAHDTILDFGLKLCTMINYMYTVGGGQEIHGARQAVQPVGDKGRVDGKG
jgi:hypothetical protein